ncbi:MAG TPA: hypothetical protein VNJ08_12170 [Bacteriovoracaceae bacterium]|nr:hypothetical protein [Bacteriovoracaceae bacterium]
MMHISFYVPLDHAEKVKDAMFVAGGGKIGTYDRCSFEFQGVGQFRPVQNSQPFIGVQGVLEKVPELKVEMVCEEQLIHAVIDALKSSHPYETPAYYVIKTLGL